MTAPDQPKAGKYELVATQWDELLSKPGEPLDYKRHVAGDVIDLNAEDARRLVKAGAVVKPGEREKAAAELAAAQLQAAQAAYDAALAKAAPDPEPSAAPSEQPKPAAAGRRAV